MTLTGTSGSGEEKDLVYSITVKTNLISTVLTTESLIPEDSEVEKNQTFSSDDNSYSITDTIAAIVSAVLALVFLIMIVCLIQVIKRRRQERRGNRLNRQIVHTITTQTFGANIGAYQHVPISNTFSWESVTSSHSPVLSPEPAGPSSSNQLSERTSYISASSESILVTAILHPPPRSEGLVGPECLHASPLVQRASSFKSGSVLENFSSSSSSTIHIHSNSMQCKMLSGATHTTDDFRSKDIKTAVEPSTSYG